MKKKMVVKTDGINYIGRVKTTKPQNYRVRGVRSEKSKKFDKYMAEARNKKMSEKDIPNYIQERFWEEAEDIIEDTIDQKEFEELYKNYKNRLHKRLDRYRNKILLNDWSYWVTFTYDDEKETEESFEKRLKITFNNLAKRNGWRIIGTWENGELEGRLHFHAFIYVPEGQMVGQLETRSQYSTKRRKMEYYVENTYFFERFGKSDWVEINRADVVDGARVRYLIKYTIKSGRKLFYSRGIASDIEIDVDTDTEVIMSFNNHGLKYFLRDVAEKVEQAARERRVQFAKLVDSFSESDIDYSEAFVFEESRVGFCDEAGLVVTIYT